MKFDKYKVTEDKHGFKFAKKGIMLGNEEQTCLMCSVPTRFIEVCSESHLCSDECVQAFNSMYDSYLAER